MNTITLTVSNGQITTTSNQIAEHFGKRHDTVLRAIDNLDCSDDFRRRNFAEASNVIVQPNGGSAKYRAFTIARDGFVFLCMGFTGKEAAQWKEKYIAAFNAMEAQLAGKPALPPPPKRQIKTREDLSFTKRDEEGRLINWAVQSLTGIWGDEFKRGEAFFAEVSELAAHSETEAYNAVRFALSGREWPGDGKHWQRRDRPGSGWGEEDGFAESIARAVIDGLRARKGGQESFDPKGGDKKRGRKALPKPKHSALPSLPMPAQQAMVLH